MNEKYLNREDAPFGIKVWEALDKTIIEVAKSQLAGRRILSIEGPYGLGLRSLPEEDRVIRENAETRMRVMAGAPRLLAYIIGEFEFPVREIATFEDMNIAMNLRPAVNAALATARMEDDIIFNGSEELGIKGLFSVSGSQSIKIKEWTKIGSAAGNIIEAINLLDKAGFHGPYSLALSPSFYNLLLRLYPQSETTELEHISTMVSDGIFKASAIPSGGVLMPSLPGLNTIVIGQDLMTGFIGPGNGTYIFSVSESLTMRINVPESLCLLSI